MDKFIARAGEVFHDPDGAPAFQSLVDVRLDEPKRPTDFLDMRTGEHPVTGERLPAWFDREMRARCTAIKRQRNRGD